MATLPCRPAALEDEEDDSANGRLLQPIGELEVLADVDVAALAGMMPGCTIPVAPSWFTEVVGEDLREIQVAILPWAVLVREDTPRKFVSLCMRLS